MKKRNQNGVTELVFIIDKSGSMCGLEADTIGGFNSLLEKQKKEDGKCFVSTVLFSSDSQVIHDRVDIDSVKPMTGKDYVPSGCTALIDAIGGAVHHIRNIHKYARPEDVPENTVFVITTDGMENSSRIYSSDKVKEMIEHQKKEYGWEFIFVGANIDSVDTAEKFGIDEDRAVNYISDSKGTQVLYDSVCCAVSSVRSEGDMGVKWKEKIKSDYKSRKHK